MNLRVGVNRVGPLRFEAWEIGRGAGHHNNSAARDAPCPFESQRLGRTICSPHELLEHINKMKEVVERYPVVRDGGLLAVRPHAVAERRAAPLQRRRHRRREGRLLLHDRRRRSDGGGGAEAALVRDDAAGDAL